MHLLALLASLAFAETLYATAPTTAQRWPDEGKGVTVTLQAGEAVEVVARQGEKVRVKKGADFGWVPAASLAATPPAPALPIDVDADALPEAPGQ